MYSSPWAAVLLAGVSACAGQIDNPELFLTGGCRTSAEALLRDECGNCHGGSEPMAELDLVSPELGALSAGATPTTTEDGMCQDGGVLVDPAAPAESLLYAKLTDPGCGDRMPLGGDALDQRDLGCLLAWIAAQ
jgi:hypothetical protein